MLFRSKDYLLKPLKPQALIERTGLALITQQKERRRRELQQKIEEDKNLILQYQDIYEDKSLIEAALNNKLVTSKDYINEKSINKRFQMTNL